MVAPGRKVKMKGIHKVIVAGLIASFVGLQPVAARADDHNRRDRYEDRWERRERQERREARHDRWEARRDRYDDRWDAGYEVWDPAPYYRRDDRRYRDYRMGREDRIYRGYDDRYYCRRSDGTAGMIVGGITGGVLGNVVTRGRGRALGTIIGAGAGAIIGRSIDEGNVVCR
jgi:Glycine zipper 2TM domain